jgi:flavin-binding protein dodecin
MGRPAASGNALGRLTVLPAAHATRMLPGSLCGLTPGNPISRMCQPQRPMSLVARMAVPNREETMADPIYKVVEVVGTSEQSISKAIDHAINKASETLRNLGWFEVAQMRGAIKDSKVQRYRVTLKVGFTLE